MSARDTDDAVRIPRRFLASVREGDTSRTRIQIAALHDVMPHKPRLDLDELEAIEPEAGS